ncbi:MAG: FkbM family methyltransferase [Symploca sp. SIO1C2]|nr:FkbM family methyltransferase [Symploca sp. SIO1C2]
MEIIRKYVAKRFRWLAYMKRYAVALSDSSYPTKITYSQHKEDCEIATMLNDFDLTTGIYIDVGANQPSYISNTYLFYRKGLNGILIEPDESNFSLLQKFRPRDISIRALVGSLSKVCQFNYSIFSVLNSVKSIPESTLLRQEYIPQVTLDEVVDCINPKWIYLLNTDTEGHDLEVLRGANETLQRTLLVCTEYHGDQERLELEKYMSDNLFAPVFSNDLNIIFRNTKPFDSYKTNKV